MISTMNAYGIVPILLVFGMLSRMPGVSGTGPVTQANRTAMLVSAREKYTAWVVAKQRINLGLHANVPTNADEVFVAGE